jgi:thiaminase
VSNELCRVRALHRSLASRNARPNSLSKIVSDHPNHKTFCARREVSQRDPEETGEFTAKIAYRAYTADTGLQDDTVKFDVALAVCLLGCG